MSPIEDLEKRDLAWISDFVMQQMVIMLRPMMDHLQETDAACDYSHRMVQRLSMDITEVRGDLERTNKYLAILRQGLGVQNEGKCVLQRTLEGSVRTVKRLDDQMESMLAVMRGVEESIAGLAQDTRLEKVKHEDLAKQVSSSTNSIEDLQVKVERLANEAHSVKDDLLSNEARLEVWQRELRELRRGQLGVVPKLEDKAGRPPPSSQSCRAGAGGAESAPWNQKKAFAASVDPLGAGKGPDTSSGFGETNSNHSGSSQQSKRVSRVGSGSGTALRLQQVWPGSIDGTAGPSSQDCDDSLGLGGSLGGSLGASTTAGDEPSGGSRLPLLAATRQSGASRSSRERPSDRSVADPGPRLRFSATMAKPESRGSPSL